MDYYEELGIQRDATGGEIREAYKLAARLLHPDLQRDRRLKELAECQMKRLGDVVAMLANPRERARYDAELTNGASRGGVALFTTPGRSGLWRTAIRHWFWVLMGSMTIGVGVWYASVGGPDIPPRFAAAESARAPNTPSATPSATPRVPARAKNRRTTADPVRVLPTGQPLPLNNTAGEAPEPISSATPPVPVAPSGEVANGEHTPAPVAAETPPASPARGRNEPRFAGQWLRTADTAGDDRAGTYPAKYVDFRLHEDQGRLAGEYRAVHSRVDKAISPEVVLRVHGDLPEGDIGILKWESNGGAKGELELTLQQPNRLLVRWWTTQFGGQEVLSSGMAVLMRLKNQ